MEKHTKTKTPQEAYQEFHDACVHFFWVVMHEMGIVKLADKLDDFLKKLKKDTL